MQTYRLPNLPIALIPLLCAAMTTAIQASPVAGRVIDANDGHPLEYVNVAALRADSTLIDGCMTDSAGRFGLNAPGAAILRLTLVGYVQKSNSVTGPDSMGDIALAPQVAELSEVTVSAPQAMTRLKGNSMITTVANTELSKLGGAIDVLDWIPMMSVSNGNVKVFGKGTPLIYINGRTMRNKAELEQLRSTDIASVEVITNPGAKYPSTVKSVVRIRTKKIKGDGLGLYARSANTFARYYSNTEQLDVKYRHNSLEIFGLGYFSTQKTRSQYDYDQRDYENGDEIRLDKREITKSRPWIGKFGANYDFNAKHSAGAYYQYMWVKGDTESASKSSSTGPAAESCEVVDTDSKGRSLSAPIHNVNAYYNGSVGRLGIDFNIDYYGMTTNKDSRDIDGDPAVTVNTVTARSHTEGSLTAEKLTFSYDFASSHIEAGQEYSRSSYKNRYDNAEGLIADERSLTKEDNNSVFAEYALTLGRWQIAAGIRYEHIVHSYTSTAGSDRRVYNDLLPSASVSTSFGDVGVSLSYRHTTSHPGFGLLDGNITYLNRWQYQSGNPGLRPTKTHSVELTAMWKDSYLQTGFSSISNPVYNTTVPYAEDDNVTLITWDNFPTAKRWDIVAGTKIKAGVWTANITAGMSAQRVNTLFRDKPKSLNNPMGVFKVTNSFRLPRRLWLFLRLGYETAGNSDNRFNGDKTELYFSAYKEFNKGMWGLRLSVYDILDRQSSDTRLYCNNIYSTTLTKTDSRCAVVTVTYNLNTSRSRYKGTGAGNSAKSRLQ